MIFDIKSYIDAKTNIQKGTLLKKCEKKFGAIFLMYAIYCAATAFASLFIMILMPGQYAIPYVIDGVVFKGLIFASALIGSYQKKDLYAVLAAVFAIINFTYCNLSSNPPLTAFFSSLFIPVSIFAAAINVLGNRVYKVLETYEEFPQFSDRFEEQKTQAEKYRHTEYFREEYEALKKKSSNTMDEI